MMDSSVISSYVALTMSSCFSGEQHDQIISITLSGKVSTS